MCLMIDISTVRKGPARAKEDIKCMKVVVKSLADPDNPTYHAVFYDPTFQYYIGKETHSKMLGSGSRLSDNIDYGLHSFKPDVNGWKRLATWIEVARRRGVLDADWGQITIEAAVLECVIPKGSLYYEGTANCIDGDAEEKGYASNWLLPLRELPRSEWENYVDDPNLTQKLLSLH